MTTPHVSRESREPLIGLWLSGREDEKPRRAHLHIFSAFGFPETKRELVVGVRGTCDIRVDGDVLVSRRHFRLLAGNADILIEDLGSTNGTFVNAMPLRGPEILHTGMHVVCGRTEFIAVDARCKIPLVAASYRSFLRRAEITHGSARAAGAAVGRSHQTIRRTLSE